MPHPTPTTRRTSDLVAADTPEKQTAFLEALADTCSVRRACRAAGVPRSTAYFWRGSDPHFAAGWEEARMRSADVLHDEAVRRAVEGVEEPVYFQGRLLNMERKYSDALLMFLLRGAKPEMYKDRIAAEISGPDGGPIAIEDIPGRIAEILATARARHEVEQAAKAAEAIG